MKYITYILLAALLSTTLYAANDETKQKRGTKQITSRCVIKGKVYSEETKTPVAYASLYIGNGGTYATMTDDNGEYTLTVPSGNHILTCSSLGFEEWSAEFTINQGDTKSIIIELSNSNIDIDDVNIEGKSNTQLRQEQGYAVNNITTTQTAARTFTTEELLNRSAGVKIRQSGGMGSEAEYIINGLSGSSVKVYINGVPIRSYGHSFSVSNLPPSTIDRIEVYKGVIPSYLADDALGGAINIITKRGGESSLSSSYSYGSLNTHNFDINGQYTDKESGFFAGGTAFYNSSDNSYKVWGDAVFVTNPETGRVEHITAERFNDKYKTIGANTNIGYTNLSWADDVRLNLNISNIDKGVQTGATMETVYGKRRSEQESYVLNLSYSKSDILPRLDVRSDFSYSYTDRTIIDTTNVKYDWTGKPVTNINGEIVHWATSGEGGTATLAASLENNFNNRTTIKYAIDREDKHTISLSGSLYKFTRDIDDPMLSILAQSLTDTRYINKYALSVSYDTKFFNDRLSLSLFYKYFYQDLALTDPVADNTGKLVPETIETDMDGNGYGTALSYKLTSTLRLNLSAEKALRLPSITEMIGNTSDNVMPNYYIRPENSININFGATVKPIELGLHNLGGGFNIFYRDVTDMIQRAEIDTGDETYNFENIGKILSKGVDFEMRYIYNDKLTITGTVSYADTRFNLQFDANGAEYLWYQDRLRNLPYLTSNGGFTYRIDNLFQRGSKFMLIYHINYTHEFFKNWESLGVAGKATIPSQLSHDVGVVYNFPSDKVSISIDGKNIFNEQLFDNYALQKPGRLIFAKINFKIL